MRGVRTLKMSSNEPKKPCLICAEPIAFAAKKCKYCGSYQDYRRHFTFSGTILSLLVALVSVLALSAPIIKSALEPKDASIKFVTATVDEKYIYVLVTNKGNEAGTFNGADLFYIEDNKVMVVELKVQDDEDKDSMYFSPKESKLLKLTSKSMPRVVTRNNEYLPDFITEDTKYVFRGLYSTAGGTIRGRDDVYWDDPFFHEFYNNISVEDSQGEGSNKGFQPTRKSDG